MHSLMVLYDKALEYVFYVCCAFSTMNFYLIWYIGLGYDVEMC